MTSYIKNGISVYPSRAVACCLQVGKRLGMKSSGRNEMLKILKQNLVLNEWCLPIGEYRSEKYFVVDNSGREPVAYFTQAGVDLTDAMIRLFE
jgi:hypothetical protein